MLNLSKEELVYLLLTLDEDSDDYVVNNFVGDSLDVLTILTELTQNVSVTLDCIQFDSENYDGFYCISVEKDEDYEETVLVSVVGAENEEKGKFYGINGNVFVANYIPERFEKDIKNYKQTDLGHIIRIDFGDHCDSCEHKEECNSINKDTSKIHMDEDDHFITQSWTDGKGNYFSRSFSSSDSKQMDKISKEWADFADRFRKG